MPLRRLERSQLWVLTLLSFFACTPRAGLHVVVEGTAPLDRLVLELQRASDREVLATGELLTPKLPASFNFVSGPRTPEGSEVRVVARAYLAGQLTAEASEQAILKTKEGARLMIVLTAQSLGGDALPPVIADGQPAGMLPMGTTSTSLSVATDEAATCKWGTEDLAYASMANTFTTTGSTTHSTTVSSLSDGQSYIFYIRCQDAAGNANATSYTVAFNVGADTVPPVISNGQPAGTLPMGTTSTTLSVATDEAATCKWGTADVGYGALPDTFTSTGATTHSATVSGLGDGQSYTYYVRCQDVAGNANATSYTFGFSVGSDTVPPVISNGQPTGTLPLGTTSTTLSVATDEAATCKWGTADAAYASLPNTFPTTGGLTHSTTASGLADGQSYTYYVRCRDAAANANSTSYTVSFSVAADTLPPVISNGQPTGTLPLGTTSTTLSVATNEAATCKWGTADAAYASLPNTFTSTGGLTHSTTASGLADGQSYTYYVRCRDAAANASPTSYTVNFSVAGATPPTDMLAHLPFDDGTGSLAVDVTGNGYNGLLVNMDSTNWVTGQVGTLALSFNGTDERVDLGNTLAFTSSFSISVWVNHPADATCERPIVNKTGGPTARDWRLVHECGGYFFSVYYASGTASASRYANVYDQTNDQWTHLVGVYNSAAQTLDMYVNGSLSNGSLFGTVPASLSTTSNNVWIGGRQSNSAFFEGMIDDVRIFNRALTAQEVSSLYVSGQ